MNRHKYKNNKKFTCFLYRCKKKVNNCFEKAILKKNITNKLQDAMYYSIDGGKRIRASLLYATIYAIGNIKKAINNKICTVNFINSLKLFAMGTANFGI